MGPFCKEYERIKPAIKARLEEFRRFRDEPLAWHLRDGGMALMPSEKNCDGRIFEELSFCLMTANTSAVMGMKAVDAIRDILMAGDIRDLQARLVSCGYRYPNKRAQYIFEAREKLKEKHGFRLRDLLGSFPDPREAREYLVREIKGFGYKEASHFLRNIGFSGLAILDKHILRTMHEQGFTDCVPKSLNRARYMENEARLGSFSRSLGIPMDDLDLLLWSMKTGYIMK